MTEISQTVYVVDDDEAVRDSLALLLRSVGLRAIVFDSAQPFLEQIDVGQPGCLVLDIRMPGISGMELAQRLRERDCGLPIIFITGHGDVPMAVEAMKLGALDFLQKPFRDQELLDRIQQALARNETDWIATRDRECIRQRLEELTPREQQVLEQLLGGKPNKVIAADLELSQRTVEIHRARIMDKMQARSLAALVQMVIQVRD
jgi:two-component system, LuxR family, response regulator FixJ